MYLSRCFYSGLPLNEEFHIREVFYFDGDKHIIIQTHILEVDNMDAAQI